MAEVRTPDASVQFSSLAFLAEASAVLGTSLDYEATLARLAELVVPRLADWCVVHLADGAGILRAVTTAHLDPSRAAQLIDLQERYPVDFDDDGGPGSVLRTGTTLHLPEVSDEMLVRRARGGEHLELMRGLGIQSVVVVPLIARQRRLGILSLVTARGRSSTVDDVALAEELGRRAALAVDNARLFQDMERAQREARFQAALLRAQNEAGVEGLLVVSPSGEMLSFNRRFAEIWGMPDDVIASRSDGAALARAMEQVVDPEGFIERVREVYEHRAVPIRDEVALIDGRVLDRYGAPCLGDDGTYYGWAWYFRDVTAQKRTEQALLASGERFATLARTLQESLLPPDLPQVRGVELASRYHPAGAGLDVGGDFYDVFQTGRGTWGIVVGDVCGKGAEAARLTALARYTVRAASMQTRTPSRILTMLNEALVRQIASEAGRDDERFASVVYASLRRSTTVASLTVSSGGHPPGLVLRGDGAVEVLPAPGILLGLFPRPQLQDVTFDLHPGDSLLLYTDGVTEARGRRGEYGQQRLASLLATCGGMSAKALAETVESAVLAHQDGVAHDDIAVLVVHAT